MQVTVLRYICTKCKAEDRAKLLDSESPMPNLICWDCGEAKGMSVQDSVRQQLGMFPKDVVEVYNV